MYLTPLAWKLNMTKYIFQKYNLTQVGLGNIQEVRGEICWCFLPCSLWVGSLLPWRTAGDASPPQWEDYLAVIRHREEQDLQKKINTCKTNVWFYWRMSKHCSEFPLQSCTCGGSPQYHHHPPYINYVYLELCTHTLSSSQFTILCLLISLPLRPPVCDPEIEPTPICNKTIDKYQTSHLIAVV